MAENYEVGKTYYLPVRVYDVMDSTYTYPVRIEFEIGTGCMDGKGAVKSDPGLLFTAYEVYLCNVTALKEEIATLKSENERLSKQNEELGTKVDDLETDCEKYRQSNIALRRVVDALTVGENKSTHRAMMMDSLMMILLEKIDEMEKKNNG